jgi:hypothetical protein
VETVHSNLELLAFLLWRMLVGGHLAGNQLLSALSLATYFGLKKFAGGEAHGLTKVLQSLSNLYALFLHEIVLDVFKLD